MINHCTHKQDVLSEKYPSLTWYKALIASHYNSWKHYFSIVKKKTRYKHQDIWSIN